MTPSSLFLAIYPPGDESYEGDAWVYPREVTYTDERFRSMAKEEGLACEEIGWPHRHGGSRQRWVALSISPA
jgi:hypothetical protein